MLRSLAMMLIINILGVNFPVYAIAANSIGYQKMVDNAQKVPSAQDRAGYRQLVEKVQDEISTSDKKKYQDLIKGVESKVKAEEGQAKELVQKAQQQIANQDLSQIDDDSEGQTASLKQMLKDYQSMSPYDVRQLDKGLFIFISLSMPETVLKSLDMLADLVGGRLVLRGLKNNSFKETVKYIQHLQDQGIKVEINPQLFDLFKVILVPTFVLMDEDRVDILQGNVSLLHALKEFSLLGDNQALAKEYLLTLEP